MSGIAALNIIVKDQSFLIGTNFQGITGVLGITEMGPINKPILVSSWIEYTREFGGLLDKSDFPLLCRRALDAGAKLYISRVGHYTDITDSSTLDGVKASGTLGAKFEAYSIGSWGNKIKVTVADAISGITNKVDITVEILSNSSLTQTIKDFDLSPTMSDVNVKFNLLSKYVKMVNNTTLTKGSVTLTGGAQDTSLITKIDYIGDSSKGTGIYSFDSITDITKIAIPEMSIPDIDIALANYADSRKDLMAIIHAPVGVDGITAYNYRDGKDIYTHSPINSWRTLMFYGDLKTVHPLTNLDRIDTPIPDVLGILSDKDSNGNVWDSFGGSTRGRIRNALGVNVNLGVASKKSLADKLDSAGINLIIEHPSFGLVIWGNSTLYKEDSLLKHANVAELMIYLNRGLKPLVESVIFEPNDPRTWRDIYFRVSTFMNQIKSNRGIIDYVYQGDQDAASVKDVVINKTADIDAGKYTFNLFVQPTVVLKYLEIKVSVTNSGANINI